MILLFFAKALSKIQQTLLFLQSFVLNLIRYRRQPRVSTLSWMGRSQKWPPECFKWDGPALPTPSSPPPITHHQYQCQNHITNNRLDVNGKPHYIASQFTGKLQQLRLRPGSSTPTAVTGPDATTRGRLRPWAQCYKKACRFCSSQGLWAMHLHAAIRQVGMSVHVRSAKSFGFSTPVHGFIKTVMPY